MTHTEWNMYRNGILDAIQHLEYRKKFLLEDLSDPERAAWENAQLCLYSFYNDSFPREWVECTEKGEEIPPDSVQPFPPRKS